MESHLSPLLHKTAVVVVVMMMVMMVVYNHHNLRQRRDRCREAEGEQKS